MKIIDDRLRNNGLPPSLTELAELCNLSRRQLIRAFRHQTGRTIGSFVQQVTLERAKSLLQETEQSISAIAAEIGFTSPAAFSTAFRRGTGESPRRFRASRSGGRCGSGSDGRRPH